MNILTCNFAHILWRLRSSSPRPTAGLDTGMDLDLSHPALADLRAACRRRVPRFVWEYLDSATGGETVKHANRAALDAVRLIPAILRGSVEPQLSVNPLGSEFARPFGIAPVGMSGLIWPGAEAALARLATDARIPACLSTVATRTPEEIGPLSGDMGWFQLYPPRDAGIRRDILARARAAGFGTLVLTADVPGPSRRERQRRARLTIPPRLTPGMLWQMALCPRWSFGTLREGVPRLRMMEGYAPRAGRAASTAHAGYLLRVAPDWAYLAALREEWPGPLVVKGVLEPDDAARLKVEGVDAVWVSNHGGRQFDAAPAVAHVLPAIRAVVGPDYPLIADGGVESGLDVLRLIALGADFAMLGRGFHYALGALGARGAAHLVHVLTEEMVSAMVQMGISRPKEARGRLAGGGE